MTVQYAILGLLSWRSLSGYDLKKIIADSALFYWSGNNNQIYKTLIQLHQEGLVRQEVQYQENLPAKKIYTITAQGLEALHAWTRSTPELPEFRHPFLIQLAWAAQFEPQALDQLLKTYQDEVQVQLLMKQEKTRRGIQAPTRSPREEYIWKMIEAHITASYEKELEWAGKLRRELQENPQLSEGGWNGLPGDQKE